MRLLFAFLAAAVSLSVHAQVFRPFPHARITVAQWAAYFAEVSAKVGTTVRLSPDKLLLGISDSATHTHYVFTRPGHPAHPAWIARHLLEDQKEVKVEQIGYFAGEEAAFADLFRFYGRMNEQLRSEMERPSEEKK